MGMTSSPPHRRRTSSGWAAASAPSRRSSSSLRWARTGCGGAAEVSFPKRSLLWTPEGSFWCHDITHALRVVEEVGKDKNRATQRLLPPSGKHTCKGVRQVAGLLAQEEQKRYQSVAATALYLAADRVDIQFAVSRLMRGLQATTVLHRLLLERLGAYLHQHPSLAWLFQCQETPNEVYAQCDADSAGDAETRRSMEGGFLLGPPPH